MLRSTVTELHRSLAGAAPALPRRLGVCMKLLHAGVGAVGERSAQAGRALSAGPAKGEPSRSLGRGQSGRFRMASLLFYF